ncbi:hypothetical protein ALC60_07493 [Trachymyrmex zeteki]|uniref:DUF4817 domain-containing protein n=1 Tax=Mycetomoellerius zeteki TaxID=64791 RepID=A0A151WZP7_9HYME|nr:hypothetical protein ALC60_07493 [Trachymyrmex zeteki]
MANYIPNEIVDILLILDECNKNYRRAFCRCAELYPNRRHPSAQQVINIERRTHRNTLLTRDRELGIPLSTAHRMLQFVQYHPYHINLVQELSKNYCKLQFCRWALDALEQNLNFFIDNNYYWSPVNPHWYRQRVSQPNLCSIKDFASMIDFLIAVWPVIKYALLYTKAFERRKFLTLSKLYPNGPFRMRGPRSDSRLVIERGKALRINTLMLRVTFHGLKCFASHLSDCEILLRIVNITAVSYINRFNSVEYPYLSSLSREISFTLDWGEFYFCAFPSLILLPRILWKILTISRWIKSTLSDCGVSDAFSAHSTRYVSTSLAGRKAVLAE